MSRRRGMPRCECLKPLYNLYDREPFEKELEPVCREQGLGVITYFSLAAGFLTGKYRQKEDLSKSPRGSRTVATYLNERGRRILEALDQVSRDLGARPASVAVACLMDRPTVTAPIASATSLDQLGDLIASTRLELGQDHRRLLDQSSSS